MTIAEEYRKIYQTEVGSISCGIIFKYSPQHNKYEFQPFSHSVAPDAVEQLCALMRRNLLFYCYGEEEVVKHYRKHRFKDLEQAADYAYQERLPHRPEKIDGLPGEVLLDLLIQLYIPDAYKLAVRPVLRQCDDFEIKGYDLTYFSLHRDEIGLWLGQVKLGDIDYCKKGIHNDLLEKFSSEYLSRQMFFVCDKQVGVTKESERLTDAVIAVNLATKEESAHVRQRKLLKCFRDNHIKIYIPCLLAYGRGSVYRDMDEIVKRIKAEADGMIKYFTSKSYSFTGFQPEILFYIFPIEDIKRLRDGTGGFYAGLRR